jgi:hypothetical protein
LAETAAETHKMLVTAYVSDAVTKKTVFKWFQMIQEGNNSLEYEKRSGRSLISRNDENITYVHTLIQAN